MLRKQSRHENDIDAIQRNFFSFQAAKFELLQPNKTFHYLPVPNWKQISIVTHRGQGNAKPDVNLTVR